MPNDKWDKRDRKIEKRREIKHMNSVHKNSEDSDKDTLKRYRRDYEKLMESFERL